MKSFYKMLALLAPMTVAPLTWGQTTPPPGVRLFPAALDGQTHFVTKWPLCGGGGHGE